MNTAILKEEIQWLLEAIKEQVGVINTYEDKIPQIELDILMDNVRKLYEKIHLIGRDNDPFTYFDHKTREASSPRPAELFVIPQEETRKEEKPKKEKPQVKIRYGDSPESTTAAEPVAADSQTEDLELFATDLQGFPGKLREARHQALGPKVRKTKQNDLKSLISINEKFLFINELFDGNLREYNENVEALNRFQDFKPALEYLDNQRKKNLWTSESVAFTRLKELLEQRFR
jgi:hypothetical protein